MKTYRFAISPRKVLACCCFLAVSGLSLAAPLTPLIDDFSDATSNSLGIQRQFINDSVTGGHTSTQQQVSAGVLSVKGDLVPPRGQPGWASAVLLLDPQGLATDASAFEGVALRIKVDKGSLSVSANSTEITNFDYHAAPIVALSDGQFQLVKIPFSTMKRAWSEQTPLNTKTIASLSIVAFSLQPDSFAFEVDDVRFY